MERSLSKATQYQPKCLLHGQSPLAQRGYTRHLQGLFNPSWGMLLERDTPLFGAIANSWVSFKGLAKHWLSLDHWAKAQLIKPHCTNNKDPGRALLNFTGIALRALFLAIKTALWQP